jgi:hypothetical protein
VPFVRPVTVIGEAEPDPVIPLGLEVTVYPVIAEPPLKLGAVKATLACVSPAAAVPIVGALGALALTVKVCCTVGAAKKDPLPAWSALMVQVPVVTKVRTPPLVIVQTLVVVEVKATDKVDVAVADNVGLFPKVCDPGLLNVMLWVVL